MPSCSQLYLFVSFRHPAALQEELRDREKQVKELTTALSKAESQLHGLQTVLQAKTGAYNRLDSEMSKLERQLKHVQAAATADADGYRQQLGILSERVLQLEGQVSAGQQREQQLQVDLVTVRTKVSLILDLKCTHEPHQVSTVSYRSMKHSRAPVQAHGLLASNLSI